MKIMREAEKETERGKKKIQKEINESKLNTVSSVCAAPIRGRDYI